MPVLNVSSREGQTVVSAAALIALSAFVSRALGLFRDRLLASTFGAGPELDAYFAAYRIPDLLFNLLILGTISAAFLPVFASSIAKGEQGLKEAFAIAHSLVTLTVLILSGCAVVLFVLAPYIVPALAPGFDMERRQMMLQLSRIMLLQPILLGISSILGSMLTTFGRFFAYAFAPVLYNVGIILGVVLLVRPLGVRGLAWGVVLGAGLHLLVQVPGAWRVGFRFRPRLAFLEDGLWQIGRLMVPRLIGLLAGQASALIVTFIGSLLAAGSIAAYTFADNLQAVPIGLVGVSFAVAVFPQLSVAAARNKATEFLGPLIRSARLVLFLILPLSFMIIPLRAQIVRVVLGTGAFNWEDTQRTLNVLGILAFGVFAQSLIPLLARAFFALRDTRTPMIASLCAIGANIVGALILGRQFGIEGLAVAAVLSGILHVVMLFLFLETRLGTFQDENLPKAIMKMTGAALTAVFAVQLLKYSIASVVDMQRAWGVLAQLVGAAGGGTLVYLGMCSLFHIEELRTLWRGVWKLRQSSFASVFFAKGSPL